MKLFESLSVEARKGPFLNIGRTVSVITNRRSQFLGQIKQEKQMSDSVSPFILSPRTSFISNVKIWPSYLVRRKNLLWLNASLAAESRSLQQMAQNWVQPVWLIDFWSFQWKSGKNLFTLKGYKLCQYYFSLFYQNWSRLCNGKVMVNGWQQGTSFGTTPSLPDRQDGKSVNASRRRLKATPKKYKWRRKRRNEWSTKTRFRFSAEMFRFRARSVFAAVSTFVRWPQDVWIDGRPLVEPIRRSVVSTTLVYKKYHSTWDCFASESPARYAFDTDRFQICHHRAINLL